MQKGGCKGDGDLDLLAFLGNQYCFETHDAYRHPPDQFGMKTVIGWSRASNFSLDNLSPGSILYNFELKFYKNQVGLSRGH